jgi:hypothetical protein
MTSYNPTILALSGANNRFVNLMFWNAGTQVGALGGVTVTGVRNKFINCHIAGGTGCTATANERSVELGTGAEENVFQNCTIGEDTTNRGNNANCEIYLNGAVANGRNSFVKCHILAYADGGTAHGAIKSAAATAQGRNTVFDDCIFEVYRPNLGADQTSAFIGTGLSTAKIIIKNSISCGYGAWDSNSSNNCVFVGMPTATASAGGGIATTN